MSASLKVAWPPCHSSTTAWAAESIVPKIDAKGMPKRTKENATNRCKENAYIDATRNKIGAKDHFLHRCNENAINRLQCRGSDALAFQRAAVADALLPACACNLQHAPLVPHGACNTTWPHDAVALGAAASVRPCVYSADSLLSAGQLADAADRPHALGHTVCRRACGAAVQAAGDGSSVPSVQQQ